MLQLHHFIKLAICIVLVSGFAGCASTPKNETTERTAGQVLDDSVITTKVKSAIFEEPTLKVFQINVKTYQGKVLLSGFVDSQQTVQKAGEVARAVAGVVAVENSLVVK